MPQELLVACKTPLKNEDHFQEEASKGKLCIPSSMWGCGEPAGGYRAVGVVSSGAVQAERWAVAGTEAEEKVKESIFSADLSSRGRMK